MHTHTNACKGIHLRNCTLFVEMSVVKLVCRSLCVPSPRIHMYTCTNTHTLALKHDLCVVVRVVAAATFMHIHLYACSQANRHICVEHNTSLTLRPNCNNACCSTPFNQRAAAANRATGVGSKELWQYLWQTNTLWEVLSARCSCWNICGYDRY